jgi:hypothetical protein
MARLVRLYDVGVTLPSLAVAEIAAVINRLDRSMLDRYRANALRAAHDLCWERESERLVGAYQQSLPEHVVRSPAVGE